MLPYSCILGSSAPVFTWNAFVKLFFFVFYSAISDGHSVAATWPTASFLHLCCATSISMLLSHPPAHKSKGVPVWDGYSIFNPTPYIIMFRNGVISGFGINLIIIRHRPSLSLLLRRRRHRPCLRVLLRVRWWTLLLPLPSSSAFLIWRWSINAYQIRQHSRVVLS